MSPDTLTGLLIDLNDGLFDECGTRAEDAAHELQTRGYSTRFTHDREGNTDALGWRARVPWCSIAAGPVATVVYDGMSHVNYPPDQTDDAIAHFVRLVEG